MYGVAAEPAERLLVRRRELQPPPPPGGGGDGVSCPLSGTYSGESQYLGQGPFAAPLRGAVACVHDPPTRNGQVASLIYGPMEAGFSTQQLSQLFTCTTAGSVPAGLDTGIAEELAEHLCGKAIDVLDGKSIDAECLKTVFSLFTDGDAFGKIVEGMPIRTTFMKR